MEKSLKRPRSMHLDLKGSSLKRSKLELLSSPDMQMLKLGSPELEKFLISNPTPASLVTPTQVFFPKNVTEEQELYAKGFVDALAQLQDSSHDDDDEDDDDDSEHSFQFKHEQDGSAVVPSYPVDMASQEKIKLERKRQRNRVAASKCRKRKLEKIAKLEDKVKALKNENENLSTVLNKLKDCVGGLRNKIMEHVQNGCQIMVSTDDT